MIEKILFRKIELWILLLLILLGLMSSIIFGWVVQHTASGGEKAGALGEMALTIAKIPTTLKKIMKGKILFGDDGNYLATDYIAKGLYSLHDLSNYKSIFPSQKFGPKYYRKDGFLEKEPLAIQARINEEGDEIIAIFDGKRHLVKTINLKVESMMKDVPAKIGASPFYFFDDGSYLIWPYGGVGLFRLDTCGNTIWELDGLYHHHFSLGDGKLYILGLPRSDFKKVDIKKWNHSDVLNIVDIETGALLKSIPIKDIAMENLPDIDPLFFKRWMKMVNEKGVLKKDFLHLNKIEVLPNELRQEYPDLPKGALLLSAKFINLLFILDPETFKIVWYSHGHTQGQHDPKFIGDNKIAVFDNSFNGNHKEPLDPSNYSSIELFDFTKNEWQTLYNMKAINGYTAHSGEFDISADNSMSLVLTLQGRVVEIDSDGQPFFEFVNVRDENSVYWQKAVQYLSSAAFDAIISNPCN